MLKSQEKLSTILLHDPFAGGPRGPAVKLYSSKFALTIPMKKATTRRIASSILFAKDFTHPRTQQVH